MPAISPMPNPTTNPIVSPGGAGAAQLSGGYNTALGSLNKSMKLLQGADSSQMMQAQQQLSQNQGRVQQGLINSGLGNTTVAQTMQQAPLQTYNQASAGIQNNLAQNQAGVLGNAAGLQSKGGEQMSQYSAMLQQLAQQQQQEQDKYAASKVTAPNMAMLG